MSVEAYIVLAVILGAVILFITELVRIDLVAILIIVALMLTDVLTPGEALRGFSNPAVITVGAMFVISAAFIKTGMVRLVAPYLSRVLRKSYTSGIAILSLSVGSVSAFINNTPVVAVFTPLVIKAANTSGKPASKLLIPLSYASILGGVCTLIGTSTNILVSGIAQQNDIPGFSMFLMAPVGLVLFLAGSLYMIVIGHRLLPDRRNDMDSLDGKFNIRDYITELELLEGAPFIGKKIMDSPIVKELDMEIIEVRRNGSKFIVPPQDMVLKEGDKLKVRCNIEKIKNLKDELKVYVSPPLAISEEGFESGDTAIVELVIPPNSEIEGKTLNQVEFKRKYRAVPLAIKHRMEIMHDNLNEMQLQAGDIILAEIKKHRLPVLQRLENGQNAPFIILSEDTLTEFNKKGFFTVLGVAVLVIALFTAGILPIVAASLLGVALLVLMGNINMKEVYEAIDWKVIFLLGGALSLGVAMQKTELADTLAHGVIDTLGNWGPVAVLAGFYLLTMILTELMSNNATAALMAPIAIVAAQEMGVSPLPLLLGVTFAASASFITPIGYQTNTMIFGAGNYRFRDFTKVGLPLAIIIWILAVVMIPLIYPF